MDEVSLQNFQSRLDETHSWPCVYLFKFIVHQKNLPRLLALLDGRPVTTRESQNGNYVAVTGQWECQTSAQVVAVYRNAARIEGIIAL